MFKNLTSLFMQGFYVQPGIFSRVTGLHTTSNVMAEPLKKKKRVDPAVEQQRIGRKIRKIEKEIKRLSRFDRRLKPIEEIEGDRQLMKELKSRQRSPIDISENEVDQRISVWKCWTRYQTEVTHRENRLYKSVLTAQQKALKCLFETSPNLYKEAIQPYSELLTKGESTGSQKEQQQQQEGEVAMNLTTLTGPYIGAPKLHGELIESTGEYDPPDGEHCDTTPKLTYDFELDSQFLAEPKKKKFTLPNK
ncbi:unnamed protein product [Trichobilharzia szidati]|nr:unnamed protein product [Trichobilharzia szidati]